MTSQTAFLVCVVVSASLITGVRAEADSPPSTSAWLVEETLAQSPDPRAYDWRMTPLQVEVGYASIMESNSFKTRSYSIGVSRSMAPGWLGRLSLRRSVSESTGSSDVLARTSFSQAGQPSRYEINLGGGYALLEGRSASPLSPKIGDLGHALYAIAGLQYNIFTSHDVEPIPAMHAVYYDIAAEAGFRFQAYLPNSLGLSLEWTYSMPLKGVNPDLPDWQRFGGNVSWSFGH